MNKIIIILFFNLLVISCKTDIKKSDSEKGIKIKDTIQIKNSNVKSEFIKDFYTNEYIDKLSKTAEFKTIEEFIVNEGIDTFKIFLKQIPDWNDPGDFLNIVITDKKGNELFNRINFSGWVRFGNNYYLPDSVISFNLIESDKALIIDNKNGKQLIVFGWVYASSPGLMTLIDLFPKPKIIFNQEFELKSILAPNENGFRNFKGGTTIFNEMTLNIEKMKIE